MKEGTRRRLSELIIEELAEKIKRHDGLRKRLEELADLPVERVAEALLQQFDSILTTDLRREVERLSVKSSPDVPPPIAVTPIVVPKPAEIPKPPKVKPPPIIEEVIEPPDLPHVSTASIMEHFSVKEPFDAVPIEFELRREDWFYLLAFSYAPDSKGKGMPTKQLSLKGVDKTNHIFLLDFGDVRLYMHKLSTSNFTLDKAGRPSITPAQSSRYKLEHESILNTVRAEEVLATLPFWTVMQGREQVVKAIDGKYVELLTALIDSHDVTEWDLEVFAFDHHILQLPSITEGVKSRTIEREARKPVVGHGVDTGTQVDDAVEPAAVADGGPDLLDQHVAGGFNRDTGQDRARRVLDDAGDGRLCEGQARDQQKPHPQDDVTSCLSH